MLLTDFKQYKMTEEIMQYMFLYLSYSQLQCKKMLLQVAGIVFHINTICFRLRLRSDTHLSRAVLLQAQII
jgi:hypothetical protein